MTRTEQKGLLQVCVDDPILGLQGPPKLRRGMSSKFLVFFAVMGVRLAYEKAQLGSRVKWIGVIYDIKEWEV